MDIKEVNNILEKGKKPVMTLTRADIDHYINEAVNEGLKPVENKIIAALNAEHSIGKIHCLLNLIDRDNSNIDLLIELHDRYKSDIDKMLQLTQVLYK